MFNSKTINFLKEKIYLIVFAIFSFLFITPSIIYMAKNKTVLNFDNEFCFLLNNSNRLFQAFIYTIIILGMIGIYYIIIKKRNKIFKNIKQVYITISIISLIFVFLVFQINTRVNATNENYKKFATNVNIVKRYEIKENGNITNELVGYLEDSKNYIQNGN